MRSTVEETGVTSTLTGLVRMLLARREMSAGMVAEKNSV